jgi:protein involved in polysaccharide export with SLBB domain
MKRLVVRGIGADDVAVEAFRPVVLARAVQAPGFFELSSAHG